MKATPPPAPKTTLVKLRIADLQTVSEANRRGHWSKHAKRTATQRFAALSTLRRSGVKPRLLLVVRLTRISPRALDDDNLRSALKAVRDGVTDYLKTLDLGVKDDADPRIAWVYGQRKEKPKFQAVDIELEWMEP